MNRQRLGSLVGAAIGLGGVAFVVRRLVLDWDDVSAAIGAASPGWIAIAVVCGVAAMSTIGWNWLVLVRPLDTTSVVREGSTWFFVGQLGKYVPGGIWPIVGQAELATRGGVARATAYSATGVSMLATLLGAMAVAVGAGLVAPFDDRSIASFDHRPIAAAVGLLLLGGLACLGASGVRRRLHRILARATRRDLRLPAARTIAMQMTRHLPVWLWFSTANVCVHRALGGQLDVELVVELVVATCVSWIAGFVIVGVPGGIGVREAVFVSLMTGPVGASAALSIAVVGRLVTIAADLLGAGGSIVVNGSRLRRRLRLGRRPSHAD